MGLIRITVKQLQCYHEHLEKMFHNTISMFGFGDNFAHVYIKGPDFENDEYLNIK